MKDKINFKAAFEELVMDIESIEYFKDKKLTMSIGKDSWKEEVQTTIISADNKKQYVDRTGFKANVLKGTEVLYTRRFEGDTDESKYLCLYYLYRDILNAGMQLIHLSFEEQKKMLDEIARLHYNKKDGQKIIA